MNETTSVSLGKHFTTFIEEQVGRGRYDSATEMVRAGLRLLEDHEAKLAALRASLVEGEESGVSSRDVLDIWSTVKDERHSPNG